MNSDKEAHASECSGRLVACPGCHKQVKASDLEVHQKDSCPERMLACHYCELSLPAKSLNEHEGSICRLLDVSSLPLA